MIKSWMQMLPSGLKEDAKADLRDMFTREQSIVDQGHKLQRLFKETIVKRIIPQVEARIASYPVDGKYSGGLEEEELTRLHAYYVDTLVPCLQGQGYSGFNPPSLTTYLETYGTEGGWHPYTDIIEIVDQLNPGAFTSLTQACPQSPGTDYLFGE
jgi:hypothetical protein